MKKRLVRILASVAIFAAGIIAFEVADLDAFWLKIAVFSASFALAGYDIVLKAVRNILRGKLFDENFLMSLATVGAFAIGEFPEAAAVMIFYQIGELFQSHAVQKSRRSIASLMDIRPEYACVLDGANTYKTSPENVKVGTQILINAGDRIPLDGRVISGNSMLDTSALTGESVPRDVSVGSEVISGCININGVLTVEVTSEYTQSTVARILNLVENASARKSKSETFITKFARIYTPAVVVAALLIAIIPPIFAAGESFVTWAYRAMSFLVVSCPCALAVSIPMSFFGGIGGAARCGILVKGGNYLEAMARVDTVVFDKTGTLTQGVFEVQRVVPNDISAELLLELCAHAENNSSHPISHSLKNAYAKPIDITRISDVTEVAGQGITASVDGKKVAAGNAKLMAQHGVQHAVADDLGTIVYVAIDGIFAGYIVISDKIKDDAARAISDLSAVGIKETIMLTGDIDRIGRQVAAQLGIGRVYTELLPEGKVQMLDEILQQKSKCSKVAFVGDGINDAPVLSRADVGIGMGALGSDAATEAADIVLMTDEPSKIATAKRIARKTVAIAMQNTVFAITIKLATLVLSAFGIANMWMAIFADVGVAVLAILNAFRALAVRKASKRAKLPNAA